MRTVLDWLQHNKEWVFSGVGVAAMTAIASWFVSRRTTRLSIPRLRVNLAFGFLTYDGPELSAQMLIFTVANPADRRLQLTCISVPLKKANLVFPSLDGEQRLPCWVEPGTNLKFWVKLSDVEDTLRHRGYTGAMNIHAVASDALGNEYTSNPVKIVLHS
jgi:hypothetical protein